MTPTDLEAELRKTTARIGALEHDMRTLVEAVQSGASDAEEGSRPMADAVWRCKKCRGLLGFYDAATDELRIRYKDHIVYVSCGPGGFVRVVCRGCAELNEQRYLTPEELAAAQDDGGGSPRR